MATSNQELSSRIVEVARQALAMGLIKGEAGNFSARVPGSDTILVTPSQVPYGRMTPEDLVSVDLQGQVQAGRHQPSYETPVHCAVYRARPEVRAVIHTEPPYVNCFGVVREEIPPILMDLSFVGGSVPVGPCMRSGSDEFGQAMLEAMGARQAVIWPNHGLLAVGASPEEALKRTWQIENGAEVYFLARQVGEPQLVPPEILAALEE